MLPVLDMHDLPIETTGYRIEPLPFDFTVSFVRGYELYIADSEGRIFKADDRNLVSTLVERAIVSEKYLG